MLCPFSMVSVPSIQSAVAGAPMSTWVLEFGPNAKKPAPEVGTGFSDRSAQAKNSARSASRAGFGLAPITVLTTSPPRKTFIAGIDVI